MKVKRDGVKVEVSPEKAAKTRFAKIVANLIKPIVESKSPEKVAVSTHRPTPVKKTLTKYEAEQRALRRARKEKGLYAL
jgi:hypothetical protein